MTFSNQIDWLKKDGPRWENLGIKLSGGLFSVCQANGADLSQKQAAYVTIPSTSNPGRQNVYRITANQTFADSSNGSPTISGNSFGVVAAAAGISYDQDMVFYLYAVENGAAASPETTVNFAIARLPNFTIAPVAAKLGKTGSAVASTQGSMFMLGNPTVADYASSSCICVGAFRMRSTANVASWAVQTLSKGSLTVPGPTGSTGPDGIGCFHETTKQVVPLGFFGAAANSYIANNGGTAPTFVLNTNASMSFYMLRTGYHHLYVSIGAPSGVGAGAVGANIYLPFEANDSIGTFSGVFINTGGTYLAQGGAAFGTNNTGLRLCGVAFPIFLLTNAAFNAGTSSQLGTTYQAELQ